MRRPTSTMLRILAAVPVLVSVNAFAGGVTFWEHAGCGGRQIGAAVDTQYMTRSYGRIFSRNNDEIRSVRLERALPGTIVRLFDARHLSRGDDWAEIIVTKYTRDLCYKLPNKEKTSPDPDQSDRALINWSEYAQQWLYGVSDWRVEGKVSSWEYDGRMGTVIGRTAIERMFINWEYPNAWWPQGSKYEYWAQDHRFRMHEPSASQMGDGYFVNFKLDHDRNNAFDDLADVRIETDHEGKPTKVQVEVRLGNDAFFQLLVQVSDEVEDYSGKNKYTVAAEAAGKIADKVYQKLLDLTDFGGREIFKDQIQHKLNEVQIGIADAAP